MALKRKVILSKNGKVEKVNSSFHHRKISSTSRTISHQTNKPSLGGGDSLSKPHQPS
jgi:hypothetical protein